MAKVKITTTPSKQTTLLPSSTQHPWFTQATPNWDPATMSSPSFATRDTYPISDREDANIEAERGETALVPDKAGLPAHYKIGGKRHLKGGTPMNVTKDTFIFSDTKKLRIKDPEILAEFGKAKGSYTPAELAKKYDINKFRKLLQDPDSDEIQVSTAEKMIANYNLKLAKLALVQESKKGFPQGIPAVAMPYMMTNQVSPDSILPLKAGESQPGTMMRFGGLPKAQNGNTGYVNMFETPESKLGPQWTMGAPSYGESEEFKKSRELAQQQSNAASGYQPIAVDPKQTGAPSTSLSVNPFSIEQDDKRMWGEPEVMTFIGAEKALTSSIGARQALKDEKAARRETDAADIIVSEQERKRGRYTTIQGYDTPDQHTIGYKSYAPELDNPAFSKEGGELPKAQWGWGGKRRVQVINPGWGYAGWGNPWGYPQPGYGYGPPQYTQISQSAGTPYTTSSSTTKKKKVVSMTPPADAVIIDYDPDKQSLDRIAAENKINPDTGKSESGKPVYLKKADGTYQRVIPLVETYEGKDSRLGTAGAKNYEYLRATLDANPKVIDKMYEQYKENVNKSTDLTPDRKAKLLSMSKDEVYNNFLQAQKHTFAILSNKGAESLKKEASEWNTTKQGKNKKYAETMKQLGFGDAERLTDDQIASFQAAYRGFQDIADSDDPDAAILKKFQMRPEGTQTGTKHTYGKDKKYISSVDDLFGSATAGQAMKPIGPLTTEPFKGTETEEDVITKTQGQAPAQYTAGRQDAPFWLQDIVNASTAFGNRMSLKKYLPWAAKVHPRTPDAAYYDPTRELAANAEQVKIQGDAAGMFAGPQAFGSRSSRLQGLGAKNAADILAKYHNLNVGVANRFSALRADIYNRADQANAAAATDLYNKTTIANQQFDNAKRQANTELAGTYVNALTNRAMTQTLNTMYPNFQVDPWSGGMLRFYKGTEMEPGEESTPVLAKISQWRKDYPGLEEETYRQAAGLGTGSKIKDQESLNAWQAYQQQMMGYGV